MKILLACDASEHSKAVVSETINSAWPTPSRFKVISVVDHAFLQSAGAKLLATAESVVKSSTELLKAGLGAEQVVEGQVLQGHPKKVNNGAPVSPLQAAKVRIGWTEYWSVACRKPCPPGQTVP